MKNLFNLFILVLAVCGTSCEPLEEKHDKDNPIDKNFTKFEVGYYEDCGDYYKTGAKVWLVDFLTTQKNEESATTSNDYFVIELLGDPSEKAPAAGEYQLSGSLEVGTAVMGQDKVEGDRVTLAGTYWCRFDYKWSALLLYAPCVSGSVTVEKGDKDNYTISVDALDQHGCPIKMSYTGTLTEYGAKTRSNLRRGAAIPVDIK